MPDTSKKLRKGQHAYRAMREAIIRVMKELDSHDRVIVVEGEKDRAALLKLGVKTEVITLRRFLKLASTDWLEKEGVSEIIVLTDFDRRGKFYTRVIRKICSGRVRVNMEYKGMLKWVLGNWAKDVESIPRLLSRLGEKEMV
ncbi:MAG: toprim domain-containing protein [Thermoproteota archaeon]